jgi:hypothetical protein
MITASRKMTGVIKQFDAVNHTINDTKGRNAFRKFLNSLHKNGNKTVDNSNPYGIDLITLNNNKIVVKAWEIEVREQNWKGDIPFPFSEINCIERKEYMWRKDKEFYDKIPFTVDKQCEVLYVQLNDICTRAVIIPGSIILKYELKPWRNRKCSGEYVRQIPIDKTIKVRIKNVVSCTHT